MGTVTKRLDDRLANRTFLFFDFRALNPECQSARTSKPNKKLRYCREIAPRAMLVNSCYVSRGMCNEVHLNYVKCIIVYTHITLALYRLD